MLARIYSLLCRHPSAAADDVLLEALRRGEADEQAAVVEALLHRNTPSGLAGLVGCFADLPVSLQRRVAESSDTLASAAARCARAESDAARASAARFVGVAHSPPLVYLLGDLARSAVPTVFEAVCQALDQLAIWVASTATDLRAGLLDKEAATAVWAQLIDLRAEIEPLIARALDTSRGADSPDLAHAASLLLENRRGPLYEAWKRHTGRAWPLVLARLSRPGESAGTASALSLCSRPGQRQDPGELLANLDQTGALDGLLEQTHWLADPTLTAALSQVAQGVWWQPTTLQAELDQRALVTDTGFIQPDHLAAGDACRWICASGVSHGSLEALLTTLLDRLHDRPAVRACLLLAAINHNEGPPLQLLKRMLGDPDQRLARMAARALARHPAGAAEKILIQHAAEATDSVRAIIARSIGARSFLTYWQRFHAMSEQTRTAAGKALLKLLPDALTRLKARLHSGPPVDRIKALCMAAELDIAPEVSEAIYTCCEHPDPHVRSKAVLMLGQVLAAGRDPRALSQLEASLNDADARVRANAIEVLERTGLSELLPLLEARSRLGRNRERANAIKAMAAMGLADPQRPLFDMLRDGREPHRLSGLWAVEQTGQWKLLDEVVRLARGDQNEQIRRSAVAAVQRMAVKMRRPAA